MQKNKIKLGSPRSFRCVVDHAKLPNVVIVGIVAVVGFIYFWRKMKAFRPLEERRCD